MASATSRAAMNKSSNGCFPKLSHLTVAVEARAFSVRKSSDVKLAVFKLYGERQGKYRKRIKHWTYAEPIPVGCVMTHPTTG